ncbi:MAG: ABC transporter substrate-binding protein [Pseudomonadota bacterium]
MIRFLVAAVLAVATPLSAQEPPSRVVVAGGDLTEIAFGLGAGDRIVAIDQTSTFPEATATLPQIGYVRRLAAEGILSLEPDLVLAAHDAGPEITFEQLRAAGVPIAMAPDTPSADSIAEKIRFVGAALGVKEAAHTAAERFLDDLAEVRAKVAKLPDTPRVLFILGLQGSTPLVGGGGTGADEMITLAGAQNAATGFKGYKPMNREAIIGAAPDAILMMAQHSERFGGIDAILARPEIALTPAGKAKRAVAMDGMLLLGFGPRTPQAIADLASALQPDAAAAAGF